MMQLHVLVLEHLRNNSGWCLAVENGIIVQVGSSTSVPLATGGSFLHLRGRSKEDALSVGFFPVATCTYYRDDETYTVYKKRPDGSYEDVFNINEPVIPERDVILV